MRKIEANFSKAALLVKITSDPTTALSWGMTLDEAKALVSAINKAVSDGERYIADMKKV